MSLSLQKFNLKRIECFVTTFYYNFTNKITMSSAKRRKCCVNKNDVYLSDVCYKYKGDNNLMLTLKAVTMVCKEALYANQLPKNKLLKEIHIVRNIQLFCLSLITCFSRIQIYIYIYITYKENLHQTDFNSGASILGCL